MCPLCWNFIPLSYFDYQVKKISSNQTSIIIYLLICFTNYLFLLSSANCDGPCRVCCPVCVFCCLWFAALFWPDLTSMNTNKIMFPWLILKDEGKTKTLSKNRNMGLSCAVLSFLLRQNRIQLFDWAGEQQEWLQLTSLYLGKDDFFLLVKLYLKIWRKVFSLPQFANGMWVKAPRPISPRSAPHVPELLLSLPLQEAPLMLWV